MKKIDLHIHSNFSYDGTFSPEKIVDFSLRKGLKIIAITDHDNVDGIKEALEYSKDKKLKVIPGVEITCTDKFGLKEIHIIGLFVDYKNELLNKLLVQSEKSMKEIIKIIRHAGGISILAHPGLYLKNMNEVIKNFIGFGGQGLEVYYPYERLYNFSKTKVNFLEKRLKLIAKHKKLIISGGSDFHGINRPSLLGEKRIGKKDFIKIKKYLALN